MFFSQVAKVQQRSGAGASLFASAVTALLVLGAVATVGGVMFVRNAVMQVLNEAGRTFVGIDQSYSYDGVHGPGAYTAGSSFSESGMSQRNTDPKCVVVCAAAFESTER